MSKYGYSAISLVNVLYSDNDGNCFMPSRETQIISLCLYDRKWRNDSRKAIRLMRIDKAISFMMTSSKGNIFRVTGPLRGEFTGPRWIPHTKASDAELWCFFDLRPNKRLSKQWWGWWFETLSSPLWRHCNVEEYCSLMFVLEWHTFWGGLSKLDKGVLNNALTTFEQQFISIINFSVTEGAKCQWIIAKNV